MSLAFEDAAAFEHAAELGEPLSAVVSSEHLGERPVLDSVDVFLLLTAAGSSEDLPADLPPSSALPFPRDLSESLRAS